MSHTHTHNQAVRLLEGARLKDEKEEEEWKQVLLKLYLNQSLVSLKMKKYRLAIAQCRKALDIQPKNVKANFRLGQVMIEIGAHTHTHTHTRARACTHTRTHAHTRTHTHLWTL